MAELAIGPSAKIQMIPPNFSVFRTGCFTSAVQQSILWAWGGSRRVRLCSKNTSTTLQDSVSDLHCDAPHLLMCLWWKTLCADFVSSHLEWNLACVANTVGCWQAAQVWAIGRGARLLGRSCMIRYCGAAMSHGSGCSMWLWRTIALPSAQWQYYEALMMPSLCTCRRHTWYAIYKICI